MYSSDDLRLYFMENFSNYFVSITKFVVEYFVIFLDLFNRKN